MDIVESILNTLLSPIGILLILIIAVLVVILKFKKPKVREVNMEDVAKEVVKEDEIFNFSEFKQLFHGSRKIGKIERFSRWGENIDDEDSLEDGVIPPETYLITFKQYKYLWKIPFLNPIKNYKMVIASDKFHAITTSVGNPQNTKAIIINPSVTFFKTMGHYFPTKGPGEFLRFTDIVIMRNALVKTHAMYEAESLKRALIDLESAYGIKKTQEETKQFMEMQKARKRWDKEYYAR